ncbi:hypothetical protein MRX58_13135 (plasmid) [Xylella fastidiosa subsp. pauca]|uniref:hypothetical protein n=1 Tax=Xylella fastidiosa TaxID=2371 RepID=UPI00241CD349|nr:hypothetical protein [Xylella fastidiosa]MDG5824443.1 hypothetical protein [Xylella fastidiosa subsp. pauca]
MFSDSLDKDAQKWIKTLRLNYSHFVAIRNLKVGETFWIAYFSGPGVSKDVLGHCEAYIKRVKVVTPLMQFGRSYGENHCVLM